ncbi:ENTH/ANTH/VHS superfamily protein [Rhynchospora pubera]|uniref:ENTH/ANTH/VHS superfamily protein n=1 Tax=Rhynchospora pubera TaxID=906938 RepID=A0AAV8BSA8_9POAL|nr:ENTH/ANTH/VHS superfamily protein [Rhynchospora pubera]
MTSPREWWRRAAAAIKDRQSLYLTRLITGSSRFRNPQLEAAVIRATSHDDRSVDYKNAARVFAWARTSPSFLLPVMWALARRAARTRSWPVALKALMLVHGILMRSDSEPVDVQGLLDLLMQIRPYGDGMEVGLVLEAMNCVLIEIFEVYSQICKGIASFLVSVFGSDHHTKMEFYLNEFGNLSPEAKRRRGIVGVMVLRKAIEQSAQLSAYFELCRSLGVMNAAELPEVEKIPEEDVHDLEMLLLGEIEEEERREYEDSVEQELEVLDVSPETQLIEITVEQTMEEDRSNVVAKEWVIFEEGCLESNFSVGAEKLWPTPPWPSLINASGGMPFVNNGNLIEI